MRGSVPPLPQYVFMAWCLVKHRDNFTFYLTFYIVDGVEFTLNYFCIELRQFLSDRNILLWKVYTSPVLWRVVFKG
jgi:hypothetical protein